MSESLKEKPRLSMDVANERFHRLGIAKAMAGAVRNCVHYQGKPLARVLKPLAESVEGLTYMVDVE